MDEYESETVAILVFFFLLVTTSYYAKIHPQLSSTIGLGMILGAIAAAAAAFGYVERFTGA